MICSVSRTTSGLLFFPVLLVVSLGFKYDGTWEVKVLSLTYRFVEFKIVSSSILWVSVEFTLWDKISAFQLFNWFTLPLYFCFPFLFLTWMTYSGSSSPPAPDVLRYTPFPLTVYVRHYGESLDVEVFSAIPSNGEAMMISNVRKGVDYDTALGAFFVGGCPGADAALSYEEMTSAM